MTKVRRVTGRNNKGQSLLEGGVALIMVMGSSILTFLMLINIGLLIYYKLQLSAVANQVAEAVVSDITNASWSGFYNPISPKELTINATERVNASLKTMNLPEAKSVVVTQPSNRIATVTITTDGPPWLIAYKGLFPKSPLTEEIGTATLSDPRPPGLLTLSVTGQPDTAVCLPCYGKFQAPYSNGTTDFATNPPPVNDYVAAFRPTISARTGYSQYCISVSAGNPTKANPAPQSDYTIFSGGWTPQ